MDRHYWSLTGKLLQEINPFRLHLCDDPDWNWGFCSHSADYWPLYYHSKLLECKLNAVYEKKKKKKGQYAGQTTYYETLSSENTKSTIPHL